MSSKTCSQYVRVKRKSQTIFLHVEPTDSFALVKEKLGAVRLLLPHPPYNAMHLPKVGFSNLF